MTSNKILLARPNSFIVKHMRKLVEDSGHKPFPIQEISQIETLPTNGVAAIVISTSVSSVVAESYFDVLGIVKKKYPDKPIFLASLTDSTAVKKAFALNEVFRAVSIQSIEEASRSSDNQSIVVIRKKDLTENELYGKTLQVLKRRIQGKA